jgi:FkbM family methyltransferase
MNRLTNSLIAITYKILRRIIIFLEESNSRLFIRISNYNELIKKLPISKRKIRLSVNGELGKIIYLNGMLGYEHETIRVWIELARAADKVIDIGAHIGIFSILAADANDKAKIYSIEPLKTNIELLYKNIKNAGFEERIIVHKIGISDRTGKADLLIKGTSGSTLQTKFWEDSNVLKKETINVNNLDEWCDTNKVNIDQRTIIKIDIETHEPTVFRACKKTLLKKPCIICEVLATFTEFELAKIFLPDEWRYFWIGPEGVSERRRIIGDPSWKFNNYVIVPVESPFIKVLFK